MHAPGQVSLHIGKAIGQGEGKLRNRVGPGLGNVVAGDGHRIEVAHLVLDKIFLDVTHHFKGELGGEDAGILALIFFKYVCLHRAPHGRKNPATDVGCFFAAWFTAVLGDKLFDLLIKGCIEETGQDNGRRPVDGHGHRGAGRAQVKAVVEHLHVVQGGDGHARVADFAVNIGPLIRVAAVEGG